jgi:hypothetical protein
MANRSRPSQQKRHKERDIAGIIPGPQPPREDMLGEDMLVDDENVDEVNEA